MTTPTTSSVWSQLSADLRRFLRRRVPDDHVADDLLQETFLRIHRSLGSLHEADRLAAWVYQIARNVIHDHYRQLPDKTVALDEADACGKPDAEASPQRCRSGEWLEELIRQLPEGYREAVQLSEIEGLPQQAVAERLGLSLSGAKSRIQRGRVMLREALDQCCTFEFDRRGNLLDVDPRPNRSVCRNCDEDGGATALKPPGACRPS
jgi:RNA polymerase sigma-70 factor (ECF subfamily)